MNAVLTTPVIGRDPYPLPNIYLEMSPAMRVLHDRYEAGFNGTTDDTGDVWAAAAHDIATFSPSTAADAAAKLMLGLHYLHPTETEHVLAIDTEYYDCTGAAEMLIASMNEAVSQVAAAAQLRPPFDAAVAEYRAKRALSDGMLLGSDGEDEAVDAYCKALDTVFETPAPDLNGLALKMELAASRYADGGVIPDEVFRDLTGDARRLAGAA